MKQILIYLLLSACFSFANAEDKTKFDAYECTGQNWVYFFEYRHIAGGEECFTGSIQKSKAKDSSSAQWEKYKGMKRDQTKAVDCWRSMARIQIDGAKCCMMNTDGLYYETGLPLCSQRAKP